MEEILTKEKAQEIMKTPGEVRGVCLKVDMDFLKKEKGEDGLRRLEKELENLGYPFEYKNIKIGDFYPVGQDIIDMWVIWQIFDFDNEKMRQMGYEAPKFSIFLKLIMQFTSLSSTLSEAPRMFREHFTIGELEVINIKEKERIVVVAIKDLNLHPVFCLSLEGYFSRLTEMIVKTKVNCREVRCTFLGDDCHEYLLQW